jgi:hypothetical protein
MTFGWLLIGTVVFGLSCLVTYALVKTASDADRAARRAQRDIFPMADVTITRPGW